MKLNEELETLRKFHGHLGPYVVVGLRMGKHARRKLGEGMMHALVRTGTKPSISCIIDGIQVSTGCTLGKGNIEVENSDTAEAVFTIGSRRLAIKLKPYLRKKIDKEMLKEKEIEQSLYYYEMEEEELFEISES